MASAAAASGRGAPSHWPPGQPLQAPGPLPRTSVAVRPGLRGHRLLQDAPRGSLASRAAGAAVAAVAAGGARRRRRLLARVARAAAGETPVFSFGVVADVQYVDQDDAYNFSGSRLRRYRQALELWERAVGWWREEDVAFIAQLGDFVDGANRGVPGEGTRALEALLRPLRGGPPAMHLVGNHELYNFSRRDLEAGIEVPGSPEPFSVAAPRAFAGGSASGGEDDAPAGRAYYSVSPGPGWRVCVLDPYEVSVLSQGGGRPGAELEVADLDADALALCQANNPNDVTQQDFARGLPKGPARRWVPFNGALSEAQLSWLRGTLQRAHEADEHTVLLSHVVLHPEATPGGNGLTLLWNYEELQAVLREAPRPPVAALCGHAHLGEHAVDAATGTHHVTFASPLEVAPGSDACAVVDAHADGTLQVRGRGVVPDATLRLGSQR